MLIHIVSPENNEIVESNDSLKVYYKLPLACALLGKSVGEIVKIGNLDNFVEIIEIVN